MGMEDDFLLEDEDDQKTIEFIKNYLPQDLKDKFTEDDLYYILDVIVDYYTSADALMYNLMKRDTLILIKMKL